MATTATINTSYAGEAAAEYIAAAVLSGNTLDNGGVEVMPNIKYRQTLRPANLSDIIKDSTCDFNATGNVTLLERILEPKKLQVNEQFCKEDFIPTWDAAEMGFSAFDELPKTFTDFLIAEHIAQVAEKMETNIWRGVKTNEGEFDGFSTLIAADGDLPAAQEITGTTVTAANVIEELGKIVDAIPERLYGKEDLFLYIPTNIYRAYVRSLGGFGANGLGAAGVNSQGNNQTLGDLVFDGVKIFWAPGLASDTAVATRKSNLVFGTGVLNDTNEVRVIDMADTDGSQNVRFVMRFTGAVQYKFAADIVTYGIANSEN